MKQFFKTLNNKSNNMKKLIMLSILCALTLSTYSQSKFNKKSKKEGCISGDCENGQGTYVYDNGEKYVGQWKDEGFHGQGTYTLPNGYKYVGEWKNDKKSGQGTYTYTSGNKYVGEWKDGKKDGQGTFTFADGTVEKGLWENNEFMEK